MALLWFLILTLTTAKTQVLRPAPTFTLEGKISPTSGFQAVIQPFLSAKNLSLIEALHLLEKAVVNVADTIFRERYPSSFVRTLITDLRTESILAKAELVFSSSSVEPIPQESDILDTIHKGLETPQKGVDILAAMPGRGQPENSTEVLNIAKALLRQTNITIISAPRRGPSTQFTTKEAFSDDLNNSSSKAYKDRVRHLKAELEPFFFEDFSSNFISLVATRFSSGSIINDIEVLFTNDGSVPSDSAIVDTIQRAARSGNLTLDITAVNGITLPPTMPPSTNASGSCGFQTVSNGLAMVLVSVRLLVQWLAL